MLQRSSRSQFVKEIVMSIALIDKNSLIRKALCTLYEDEKKWICEKQKEAIYAIMNDVSSLICIFSIEEEKMTLIMILAMLNESKMTIVVTSYISLTNDLEKQYKAAKISCLH